jgi:CRISPR-associated endoribonuclease Cas6
MLVSIVITVETDAETLLPRNVGRAHYAAILQRLRSVAPSLVAAIHDSDGPKPLTCSDILNGRSNREGTRLEAATPYYLRVTGLTQNASQALLEALVENPPAAIEIVRHPLRVTGATANGAEHGWAGSTTYETLAARQMLPGGDSLPRQVTMQFASPTAFKQAGRQMPLPLPDLVFGSLVERWNRFSPLALSPEMRRFAAEMLAVTRYRLQSRPVPQKNGALRIGGVGTATYRALGGDRYWLATMQMLAEFSRYSGVGVQTATGMGQARRLEPD